MKRNLLPVISFVLCLFLLASCSNAGNNTQTDISNTKQKFSIIYYDYFDTVSTIVGYEEDPEAFNAIVSELEGLLENYHKCYDIYHTYKSMTNICDLNQVAKDGPVEVSKEIIDLLTFCKEMYKTTNGMTNVAMGSVLSIWHTYREEGIDNPLAAKLPPMEDLLEASEHCNMDDLVIDEENSTVFFKDPDLKLDVGAVAKGYTAERLAQYLIEHGYNNYAVNLGGNIRTIGPKADESAWVAGIQNPDLTSEQKYVLNASVMDMALVTSGNYQRYYYVDGVKYHHIIHPETLMPRNDFNSVSILTTDSGMCDSLSTACFNLSLEDGMKLIESLPDTEAMWIAADGTVRYSSGFEKYISE